MPSFQSLHFTKGNGIPAPDIQCPGKASFYKLIIATDKRSALHIPRRRHGLRVFCKNFFHGNAKKRLQLVELILHARLAAATPSSRPAVKCPRCRSLMINHHRVPLRGLEPQLNSRRGYGTAE